MTETIKEEEESQEQIGDTPEIEEIEVWTDVERNLDISVADSFDGLKRVEYEEESGSDEDFNTDDMEQDNISIYTDISSTSDSELVQHEEQEGFFGLENEGEENTDDFTPLPTHDDIVREEWSMYPETEVEDEGRENEIEEEPRREKQKTKKKKKKDKKKDKDKKKHDKDRERIVDLEKERIRAEEKRPFEFAPKEAIREVQTPPPTVTVEERSVVVATQEQQESPFISSGFVSNVNSFFIVESS